jgi:hypothetical protein
MPTEMGIWRIDKATGSGRTEALAKLTSAKFDNELRLEKLLAVQLDVLGSELLGIGRQVITPTGKRADILAIDPAGELYVIELKRDRTPREAIAQLLDYGSWASELTHEQLLAIYREQQPDLPFEQAFANRFGREGTPPESLNQAHHLLLVASELDVASERIINYCIDFGVPINAVFFRYFKDGEDEYLARSWVVDPEQAETKIKEVGKEAWTGDYYVSFGEGNTRNWDDARKYGFVSAGGGIWYSRTLNMLHPPGRVLVHIPGSGFVGVGQVTGDRVKASELMVDVHGAQVPLTQVSGLKGSYSPANAHDSELAEYAVPVKWLAEVPREKSYWEPGLFANQNSVCKLRNKFTRDRVLAHFGVANQTSD